MLTNFLPYHAMVKNLKI